MTNDKKIRTIIVDDEPLARKGLAIRLGDYAEIEIVAQCANGEEAVKQIKALGPELVLLDIQMPLLNGFQVIQALEKDNIPLPAVVFVTAFDQYAIQAFEIHALDYLLKPVDDCRLAATIEKVKSYRATQKDQQDKLKLAALVAKYVGDDCEEVLRSLAAGEEIGKGKYATNLVIKEAGEISRIKVDEIDWIDAAGDYMCVHVNDGQTHILRKTMKELEAELNPNTFIRVHRSAIVNAGCIVKLSSHISGEYYVILKNGQSLKVSRSYKDKVKNFISR
ncbi:LytR/AlgR family response regulator transcription factor [Flocculibacter collagenilyticus]|uniref:LytR/AlgR family response regulator transcription factor n=1 Tax=Flocculibacter collagenilyticus TaxID=2744479 RepID=UPI0018F7ACDE|nr:LytTR family transcriptional regulator DNA-binding domain-containing protein [Flocculibacter collagenilyticus]